MRVVCCPAVGMLACVVSASVVVIAVGIFPLVLVFVAIILRIRLSLITSIPYVTEIVQSLFNDTIVFFPNLSYILCLLIN